MNQRHVVVIGNGMVGARFAEEVARRDPTGQRVHLSVLGAEEQPAYNRVLLPGVVSGAYTPTDTYLPRPDQPSIRVRTGTAARAIDPGSRDLTLDDGTQMDYDELVLATGARAAFPPITGVTTAEGTPAPGVTALRDMADCHRIQTLVRPGAPAVVLGGGVLGLETARALTQRGVRVAVVEAAPWLMRRQIDQTAATILAQHYQALGVAVHSWRVAARWIPHTGLELDDGRVLAGDTLIITAGVRANTELATDAGLAVEHGILIDDTLTTSHPRIHAIGDCAQHPGGGAGLIQPGWEQAAVLADLLTGTAPETRYTGARPITRLKAEGIDLTALGETQTDTAETVTIADPHGGRYAKLSIRHDRIAGAILLGFPDAAATIAQLFDTQTAVPTDRLALLQGRPQPGTDDTQTAAQADPLICRCNAVTRNQIEAAWLDGARTPTDIATQTRATTGCGSCTHDVNTLLTGWNTDPPTEPSDTTEYWCAARCSWPLFALPPAGRMDTTAGYLGEAGRHRSACLRVIRGDAGEAGKT